MHSAQVIPYYDKVDQDVRAIVQKGGRPEVHISLSLLVLKS